MKQSYTEEKLIQFIYGECDILERLEIEDALENDFFLKDAYMSLFDAYKLLPHEVFSPSQNSFYTILAYSSKPCVMEV